MKKIIIISFIILLYVSCRSTSPMVSDTANGITKDSIQKKIVATGVIQQQGITTYQYGTHVLLDTNGNTMYALKSVQLKLNSFLGKKVKLEGYSIAGYPVSGGPEFIEVAAIKEIVNE